MRATLVWLFLCALLIAAGVSGQIQRPACNTLTTQASCQLRADASPSPNITRTITSYPEYQTPMNAVHTIQNPTRMPGLDTYGYFNPIFTEWMVHIPTSENERFEYDSVVKTIHLSVEEMNSTGQVWVMGVRLAPGLSFGLNGDNNVNVTNAINWSPNYIQKSLVIMEVTTAAFQCISNTVVTTRTRFTCTLPANWIVPASGYVAIMQTRYNVVLTARNSAAHINYQYVNLLRGLGSTEFPQSFARGSLMYPAPWPTTPSFPAVDFYWTAEVTSSDCNLPIIQIGQQLAGVDRFESTFNATREYFSWSTPMDGTMQATEDQYVTRIDYAVSYNPSAGSRLTAEVFCPVDPNAPVTIGGSLALRKLSERVLPVVIVNNGYHVRATARLSPPIFMPSGCIMLFRRSVIPFVIYRPVTTNTGVPMLYFQFPQSNLFDNILVNSVTNFQVNEISPSWQVFDMYLHVERFNMNSKPACDNSFCYWSTTNSSCSNGIPQLCSSGDLACIRSFLQYTPGNVGSVNGLSRSALCTGIVNELPCRDRTNPAPPTDIPQAYASRADYVTPLNAVGTPTNPTAVANQTTYLYFAPSVNNWVIIPNNIENRVRYTAAIRRVNIQVESADAAAVIYIFGAVLANVARTPGVFQDQFNTAAWFNNSNAMNFWTSQSQQSVVYWDIVTTPFLCLSNQVITTRTRISCTPPENWVVPEGGYIGIGYNWRNVVLTARNAAGNLNHEYLVSVAAPNGFIGTALAMNARLFSVNWPVNTATPAPDMWFVADYANTDCWNHVQVNNRLSPYNVINSPDSGLYGFSWTTPLDGTMFASEDQWVKRIDYAQAFNAGNVADTFSVWCPVNMSSTPVVGSNFTMIKISEVQGPFMRNLNAAVMMITFKPSPPIFMPRGCYLMMRRTSSSFPISRPPSSYTGYPMLYFRFNDRPQFTGIDNNVPTDFQVYTASSTWPVHDVSITVDRLNANAKPSCDAAFCSWTNVNRSCLTGSARACSFYSSDQCSNPFDAWSCSFDSSMGFCADSRFECAAITDPLACIRNTNCRPNFLTRSPSGAYVCESRMNSLPNCATFNNANGRLPTCPLSCFTDTLAGPDNFQLCLQNFNESRQMFEGRCDRLSFSQNACLNHWCQWSNGQCYNPGAAPIEQIDLSMTQAAIEAGSETVTEDAGRPILQFRVSVPGTVFNPNNPDQQAFAIGDFHSDSFVDLPPSQCFSSDFRIRLQPRPDLFNYNQTQFVADRRAAFSAAGPGNLNFAPDSINYAFGGIVVVGGNSPIVNTQWVNNREIYQVTVDPVNMRVPCGGVRILSNNPGVLVQYEVTTNWLTRVVSTTDRKGYHLYVHTFVHTISKVGSGAWTIGPLLKGAFAHSVRPPRWLPTGTANIWTQKVYIDLQVAHDGNTAFSTLPIPSSVTIGTNCYNARVAFVQSGPLPCTANYCRATVVVNTAPRLCTSGQCFATCNGNSLTSAQDGLYSLQVSTHRCPITNGQRSLSSTGCTPTGHTYVFTTTVNATFVAPSTQLQIGTSYRVRANQERFFQSIVNSTGATYLPAVISNPDNTVVGSNLAEFSVGFSDVDFGSTYTARITHVTISNVVSNGRPSINLVSPGVYASFVTTQPCVQHYGTGNCQSYAISGHGIWTAMQSNLVTVTTTYDIVYVDPANPTTSTVINGHTGIQTRSFNLAVVIPSSSSVSSTAAAGTSAPVAATSQPQPEPQPQTVEEESSSSDTTVIIGGVVGGAGGVLAIGGGVWWWLARSRMMATTGTGPRFSPL